MAFIQKNWVDVPDPSNPPADALPIDSANLNRIEDGIYESTSCMVGFISFYTLSTPPNGWLVCDGSAVSRDIYASLFSVIGETYGSGDGSTTFNLPDLRGEFIRGWNSSSNGIDVGREFGSKQDATRFFTSAYSTQYDSNGESVGSFSGNTYGGSYTGSGTVYSIRPNNISLLPCIFAGLATKEV